MTTPLKLNPSPGSAHEVVLRDDVVMRFRYIPAGEFRMGQRGSGRTSEEPVHQVVIADGFWLGETPVTQAQFAVWTKAHKNHFADKSNHPAESMDWFQAVAFCEWLQREFVSQFPTGPYWAQLPSEAQWEYACRAGSETEYYTGDGEAALKRAGWFGEEFGSGSTHPVGSPDTKDGKEANLWKLFDMHGNVWEWCADVWDAKAYAERPDGWKAHVWGLEHAGGDAEYWDDAAREAESPDRVVRGGSWYVTARICRAAIRYRGEPSHRNGNCGFRVCLARSRPPAESSTGEAEPRPGGEPRRDDEVEPDGRGSAGGSGVDLSRERLPRT